MLIRSSFKGKSNNFFSQCYIVDSPQIVKVKVRRSDSVRPVIFPVSLVSCVDHGYGLTIPSGELFMGNQL